MRASRSGAVALVAAAVIAGAGAPAGEAAGRASAARMEMAGPSGRALVLLDRTARGRFARASASAVLSRRELRRAGPLVPQVGVLTVAVPRGESFRRFARRLKRDPAVTSVERDVARQPRFLPADPAIVNPDSSFTVLPGQDVVPYQWYLRREGFPQAWDLSRGAGVLVGVIDSGLDASHPDLAGKVVAVRDQDAVNGAGGDEVGHGTHVAGLACGATNNQNGIAGAGFDCGLLIEKSDLTSASVIASIVDAVDRGAKVINMSFGGGSESLGEQRAIRYALRHDVVLVAAASDSAAVEQGHPAKDLQPTGTGPRLDEGNGLVVTAADASGARASFAGRGSQISLAAFGDTDADGPPGIFSTFPGGTTLIETGQTTPPSAPCFFCRLSLEGDARYAYLAGTSMAAPQVAGAAALVRSANPRLSRVAVVRLLKQTAGGHGAWNSSVGWGVLDAGAAVSAAVGLARDTVAPVTRARGGRKRRAARRFGLRWRGRDTAGPGVAASGIESYRVYAREARGRFRLIAATRRRSARFVGQRGRRYSFYVQARDRAGNVEPVPGRPDFLVRVRRG